jgi:hypothetical protein
MLCVTPWKDKYLHGFNVAHGSGERWTPPDEGFSDRCLFEWYGSLEQSPVVVEDDVDKQPPWEEGLPKEQEYAQIVTHFRRNWMDSNGETHDYTFLGTRNKLAPCAGQTKVTLLSGQALSSGLGPKLQLEKRRANYFTQNTGMEWTGDWTDGFEIALSQQDLRRLDLASRFITKTLNGGYPDLAVGIWIRQCQPSSKGLPFNAFRVLPDAESPLCDRQPNCTSDVFNDPFPRSENRGPYSIYKRDILFLLGAALVQAGYAGVHLAALRIMFPTPTERLLWKIACFYLFGISGCVGLYFLSVVWVFVLEHNCISRLTDKIPRPHWLPRRHPPKKSAPAPRTPTTDAAPTQTATLLQPLPDSFTIIPGCFLVFWMLMLGMLLMFLLSRVYIVLKSFISLRRVPVGVYQTPKLNVMDNFPHL